MVCQQRIRQEKHPLTRKTGVLIAWAFASTVPHEIHHHRPFNERSPFSEREGQQDS